MLSRGSDLHQNLQIKAGVTLIYCHAPLGASADVAWKSLVIVLEDSSEWQQRCLWSATSPFLFRNSLYNHHNCKMLFLKRETNIQKTDKIV